MAWAATRLGRSVAGKKVATYVGVTWLDVARNRRTLSWRAYESHKNFLLHTGYWGVLASEQIGGQPSSARVFAARGPSLSQWLDPRRFEGTESLGSWRSRMGNRLFPN